MTDFSDQNISLERRISLLRSLPSFETLEENVLRQIAENLGVERIDAGKEIVHESHLGDRMYLIESGTVDVSTDGPGGTVRLGQLGAGEMFGEIALLSSARRRRATVAAKTSVVALTLTLPQFERLTALYPEVRLDLACAADALMQLRLEALMSAKAQRMDSIVKSPLGF